MADGLEIACRCGQVRIGLAAPSWSSGMRVKCYCKDCQTAARALGAEDVLDAAGGTDIWQTTPDQLDIRAGADQLRILRLSPRGIFRWYAACCDTPICNSLPRLGLPFAGVILRGPVLAQVEARVGRVVAHVNTAGAVRGKGAPGADVKFGLAGMAVLRRMAACLISGRATRSPLRQADGTPIAKERVLSLEERKAARP